MTETVEDWGGVQPPSELFQVFSRREDATIRWLAYAPERLPQWDPTKITTGHDVDVGYAYEIVNELFTRGEARILAEHLKEHGEEAVTIRQMEMPIDLDRHSAVTPAAVGWISPPEKEHLPIFGLDVVGYVSASLQ